MISRKACAAIALPLVLAVLPALAAEAQNEGQRPASAASTPGSGRPMGMMGGHMPMMGMMRGQGDMGMMMGGIGMMSAWAGHVDGRIAFLKAELKITDAQLPQWNAVADAMQANAKTMADMRASMMQTAGAATLPDRLAAREKMFAARLDAVKTLKSAIDPLYAALDNDQKKTADEIMTGMGSGMAMGGRGRGCAAP